MCLVPRRGATQASLVNNLSCPTIAERPIEFQGLFSRLSHRLLLAFGPLAMGVGAARDVVGIWRGAISGNMKVSFQAARSIG